MRNLRLPILILLAISLFSACGPAEQGGNDATPDNPGTVADTTKPTVSSVSPSNGSANIAVNSAITVTFSEAMDASTLNASTFTLSYASGTVSGTVICNGSTTMFTPSLNLSYNTTYTATITTGAEDAAGNTLASSYSWNFTTGIASDTTPPTISSTSPANSTTGVAVNSAITTTFSENMDASTITTSTFTLKQGATLVSGTVAYSGTTAIFTPVSSLLYNTTYTATVTTGVKDAAGNAVAINYSWSFATGAIPGPVVVTSVAGAISSSAVLKSDGTVWEWGDSTLGSTPTIVTAFSGVTAIRGSGSHGSTDFAAIRNDGTLWVWNTTPYQVNGISNVLDICLGGSYSLALMNDGTVLGWGDNTYGQLGDGTTTYRSTPVQVYNLTNVSSIACGWYYSIALKNDGTVWTWGRNDDGQLGDGTTTTRGIPVQAGITGVKAIEGSFARTYVVKNDGTVWQWGQYLGSPNPNPTQINGFTEIVSIAAGDGHLLAIKDDGTLWVWGGNIYGQLGDGTTTSRLSPIQVNNLTNVTAIAAGKSHSVALKSDGTVWTWGYNYYGQLGGGTTTNRSTPGQVSGL